jgi:uncharacterized protein YqgC (DUF456 family)
VYYVWATLLFLLNGTSWLSNSIALPGNWLIVLFSALFAALVPVETGYGMSWTVVGVLLGLAVLGEVVEFAAGAAGVGKQGGSRRGMALAIVGTMVGSIAGAFVSIPIPILGPIVGALVGGAVGAFAGAWLGEMWKGRTWQKGVEVGSGAFVGRLLGTAGKLAIGAMMVVIATIDSFF